MSPIATALAAAGFALLVLAALTAIVWAREHGAQPARAVAGWVRARWLRLVPEPRYASTVYACAYALFVATGVVTLAWPPQSLEGVFGAGGMTVVGLMFLVGGALGMLAGWREWWELERWAIVAMVAGLAAYAYIVIVLHFQSTGSRLTQAGVILIASCVLALRLGMIWRYPFKPRG
ncbi:hypothetical protein Leucomu_13215 [Leucobacter muris]|uniref:MFS transporter permease n=1 Tax=Leucobacter muris TaxID=1935379 RepID=A0ABX5QI20_9MICO|nr:hypothetical protein [Leucobacter muris]QAB18338.1 hypothetical protein Leucomu_10785 [Leucobacter muris]QAB18741.1 hypothetical protein Leucomu_13215 [Leucobacter muris]